MKPLFLYEGLKKGEELLHELQFRDKVKSAEYHYATEFEFDGFFDEDLNEKIFQIIKQLSKQIEFETFKMGVSWPDVSDAEKSHLKFSVQTALMKRIESELKKKMTLTISDVEFLINFQQKIVCIRLRPVYVRGRYCKFSREIAQTEFFCNKCRGSGCWYCQNTGHFSTESVEQLIGKVMVPFFEGKLLIMHGAGREDMDVLMLGDGRPFIAEILLPLKRFADVKAIEKEINSTYKGKISVNSLELCTLGDVSPLKDAHHHKVYSAYVTSDKPANLEMLKIGEKIDVIQKTPLRVVKRRADLDREKTVVIERVGKINENEFVLELRTSHGTYVKEFISGDDGRTKPSISSITGARCSCKLLDVVEICE
jgi:tRNA pseudouridine synthase 10